MAKRKAPAAAGDDNKSRSAKKSKAEQLAAAKKWADEKKKSVTAASPNRSRTGPAIASNQPGGSAAKSRAAATSCETKGGSSFLKAARKNGQAAATGGSSKKSVTKPKTKTDGVNENDESKHVKDSDRKVSGSKIPLKYIISLLILLAVNVGAVSYIQFQQSQLDHFKSQCDAELEKLAVQLKQREQARSVIETGADVLNKDRLKEGTIEQIRFAGKVYGLMATKMDELNGKEKAEWLNVVHNLESLYRRSRTELEQHRDPLM